MMTRRSIVILLPMLALSLVGLEANAVGSGQELLVCTYKGWWNDCPVAEDPDAVCINDPKVYVGKIPYKLTIDYKKKVVDLNGIKGRIYPLSEGRSYVAWDLALLGQPEIIREFRFNALRVVLQTGGKHVLFVCGERRR